MSVAEVSLRNSGEVPVERAPRFPRRRSFLNKDAPHFLFEEPDMKGFVIQNRR